MAGKYKVLLKLIVIGAYKIKIISYHCLIKKPEKH
jgi:hypothetical protein